MSRNRTESPPMEEKALTQKTKNPIILYIIGQHSAQIYSTVFGYRTNLLGSMGFLWSKQNQNQLLEEQELPHSMFPMKPPKQMELVSLEPAHSPSQQLQKGSSNITNLITTSRHLEPHIHNLNLKSNSSTAVQSERTRTKRGTC